MANDCSKQFPSGMSNNCSRQPLINPGGILIHCNDMRSLFWGYQILVTIFCHGKVGKYTSVSVNILRKVGYFFLCYTGQGSAWC